MVKSRKMHYVITQEGGGSVMCVCVTGRVKKWVWQERGSVRCVCV